MNSQIEMIKKHGLMIRGNLGQHLLVDSNIQTKIVNLLEIEKGEQVIEVGPGLGALTNQILRRGANVLAVEKDARFVSILKEELKAVAKENFKIEHGDVLKFDFKKHISKPPVKFASNLPYYITAPILTTLIEKRELFSKCVLMMQKEVCDRLLASPGSKDYGRLTLFVRYYAHAEHAFDVSKNCFTPKPMVASSVLTLTFHNSIHQMKKEEEQKLFKIIEVAFSQRRKTLVGLLVKAGFLKSDKTRLLEVFEALGWSEKVRGEELSLKDFMALTKAL